MDLSVIIVNYNVKYFLEQCLYSVFKAVNDLQTEVFVVDNNSADGSVQMIAEKFPLVKLIANKENAGFARANNQAIRESSGRYVLLLNPDTVVQEDTFSKCIAYMDKNPDAGCLGVRMIDGKGNFLPESKRALPTPAVAFYKIFGLSSLFPRSKRFGKYHLGYLDPSKINDVDVIAGAFMLMRKTALDKTGLLDETFFMYGEDIDMSYRFKLAGFRNVYFPETAIIHYKGESTRKSSINYVLVFYRAMIIFAQKHFSGSTYRFYSLLIHLAIYFRATVSILSRFLAGIITPLLDAVTIFAGYSLFLPLWEKQYFGYRGYYPEQYMHYVVPAYIAVWMFSVFIATGYENKTKLAELVRGVLSGSLIILVVYALLPESWRFSRALILIGTLWVLIATIVIRYLLHILDKRFSLEISGKKKRIIIIGDVHECNRVYSIVRQTQVIPQLIGFVNPGEIRIDHQFIGQIDQIDEIVRVNQADELIFCASSVTSEQIIKTMLQFTHSGIDFKIAPPESLSVIGSNSSDVSGELYVLHFNTLSRTLNKRKKRLFDIVLSLILLAGFPVFLFMVRNPIGLLGNIFGVLLGTTSWVGYYRSVGGDHPGLPFIRKGVLTPADSLHQPVISDAVAQQINLAYAKDYKVTFDLKMMLNNIELLGRRTKI